MICDIDPAANAFWIANGYEKFRYEYDLTPDDLVVDLGAFDGAWAQKIHDKYGCQVIAAEPNNTANWLTHTNWATLINKAASTNDIPLKFGGNSYYLTHFEPGEQVFECFDVLDLFYQQIGLMKINIEGMEWAVMQRILDHKVAHYVKHFQIQFHKLSHLSDIAYRDIENRLSETHTRQWQVPFVWESWTRR